MAETDIVRGAGDPVAAPGLVATLLGLMRDSLSAGSDRAAVDAMLRRLAGVLGDVILVVGREDAGTLELVGVSVEDGTRFGTDATSVPSDLGVASQALRGAPVVVADAAAEPAWFDLTGRGRCGVYLPMRLPDRVWGVFAVEWTTVGPAGRADLTAMQALADAMAALLESMRVREEAERRAGLESRLRRDRDAQAAVITAGLQAADTETALVRMVRETRHQLGWEALALLTVHPDGTMQVVAQQGYPPTTQDRTFRVDRGIVGLVATTGRGHVAADVTRDPHYDAVHAGTRSEVCAPLRVAGEVRAVINAESPEPGRFGARDLEVLGRLADQMALVLHQAQLLSREKDTVAWLHDLERLKSRVLTVASHELRTPLTVVRGFAEVLIDQAGRLDAEHTREYAQAIERQASQLSRTVDQMLLAAQLEQGQLSVHVSNVSLGRVVAEALEDDVRRASIEVGAGVASLEVRADPFRLAQVLESLFDNAIKFAGSAGRIQLAARRMGEHVRLLLRDEGPGIPGRDHEAVFAAFHQLGEGGVAGRRGVGLGLSVARELVAMMGGELRLASAPGYGATFTIDLPAA